MLEQWTMEEILEEMGISPEELIDILLAAGYELPEYIQERDFELDYGLQDEQPPKEAGTSQAS